MSLSSLMQRIRTALLAVLILVVIFSLAGCGSTPVARKAPGAGESVASHRATKVGHQVGKDSGRTDVVRKTARKTTGATPEEA